MSPIATTLPSESPDTGDGELRAAQFPRFDAIPDADLLDTSVQPGDPGYPLTELLVRSGENPTWVRAADITLTMEDLVDCRPHGTSWGEGMTLPAIDPFPACNIALRHQPFREGALYSESAQGTQFTLYSPLAEGVHLLIFDKGGEERYRIPMGKTASGEWTTFLQAAYPGTHYNYRVDGAFDPSHNRYFNPAKVVTDPRATAFSTSLPNSPHFMNDYPHLACQAVTIEGEV